MSIFLAACYGAVAQPQHDAVAKVTYWHVPGGYDVANARAVTAYFLSMDAAEAFVKVWSKDPQRAHLEPLTRS